MGDLGSIGAHAVTLSDNMLRAVQMPETGEVFLPLVRLSHADWASDLRLVCNDEPISHGGEIYEPRAFSITLPDQDGESTPVVQWSVDAVLQDIIAEIRGATSKIDADVFYVLASTPDVVELEYSDLELTTVQYSETRIGGPLSIASILDEPFGYLTLTPNTAPGLF